MAYKATRVADMSPRQHLWRRCWKRHCDMKSRMRGGGAIRATAAGMRDMLQSAWVCPLCSCILTLDHIKPSSAEFDHIEPIGRGGDHCLSNMRVICRSCHEKEEHRQPRK